MQELKYFKKSLVNTNKVTAILNPNVLLNMAGCG